MPSTYSTSLRLELIGDGEQAGTWGQTTNRNLGTLLEQAVAGVAAVTHNDAVNYTLTSLSGLSDQARCMVLNVTGTLTAARNVVAPAVAKTYVVRNNTSGGFAITIKTSGGTGVSVANGATAWVWCDGTDFRSALTDGSGLTGLNGSNIATGTVPLARLPTIPAANTSGFATVATTGSAADLTGTIGTARLGTGTANSTTWLRGDQTWTAITAGAVSGLAASATTDTTNAANISTGTLGTARLGTGIANSGSWLRGDQTWQAITAGAVSGLAASATTDTTNAANISTGTLGTARLGTGVANTGSWLRGDQTWQAITAGAVSGLAASATTDTTNAANISTGTLGTARLATGTANSTTWLRGDQTWQGITAGAVSGLAASATTDTTNAANISSGTLPVARLNGGGSGTFVRGDGSYSSTLTANQTITGDLTLYRSGAPTSGALFLGNSGTRYLYYDGSTYILNGASMLCAGYQIQSQRELKQDIDPMQPGALARVLGWKLYEYAYKEQPNRRVLGWMADEADARISTGKGIDLHSAVAELAAAVQELAKKVR